MLTNNTSLRVLGLAGVIGAFTLLQACAPAESGDDVKVTTSKGVSAQGATPDGKVGAMPPAGYVVKWSKCTNYIEGDANMRNNSRVVKPNANGLIPIHRVEPVAGGARFNVRLIKPSAVNAKMWGTGIDSQTGKSTAFFKIGQLVNVKTASGAIVQYTITSWNLGEPVRQKDGRLAYQDTCFRNPKYAGKDTAGYWAEGSELAATCIVEDLNSDYNAISAIYGWTALTNWADGKSVMGNEPGVNDHPDWACFEGKAEKGGGFLYSGYAAALNDINGAERDGAGVYYNTDTACHMIVNSGYESPGAKRPATKSLPAPGIIATSTLILWRPVNPNVTIANALEPAVDPVEPSPEPTDATVDESDTLPL